MKQSQEFRDYFRQSQMYKQCSQQMEQGEYMMPACRNATVAANRLNEAHFSINFDKVSEYTCIKQFHFHYKQDIFP